MTEAGKRKSACAALTVIAAALDLTSKYAIRAHPVSDWPWPGFFELTTHHNFGLIGNAPVPQPVILAVTLFIMLVLTHKIFLDGKDNERKESLALALILGGAIGNFYDRLHLGFVFDWMMVFNTSIFNIADIAIAGGLAWYAWLILTKRKT
ncbi:MAG: signal peptidase II [Patescibacteria group bacterium]